MEDFKIVDMFVNRQELAIKETEIKYSKYLGKIAYNILNDWDDSEEVVNDTYLKSWNSIPPHIPQVRSVFLAKITRETAIDVYRKRNSKKRYASEYAISLEEMDIDTVSDKNVEDEVSTKELSRVISDFISRLEKEQRVMFVGRCYYMDSIRDIAGYTYSSESKVKSCLYRIRKELILFLEREGF